MKIISQTLALAALSLPLLAGAASKSTVMQVSFEIKESCTVATGANAAKAAQPAVACQLKAPYQLTRNAEPAAVAPAASSERSNAISTQTGIQDWTITF